MSWQNKGAPEGTNVNLARLHEGYRWADRWYGYKRTYRRCFRHPKTTVERAAWDEEYGRAKRSPRNLPNTYDDISFSWYVRRSWKCYRATQYRPK